MTDHLPALPVKQRYSAPALHKGLDIIEALSDAPQGYTLNQLSEVLGKTVHEIFRMVTTLLEREYIQIDEYNRYSLSLKLFGIVHKQEPVNTLIKESIPLLAELSARSMQSSHLAIYQNGRVIIVTQQESPERWSFGLKTGVFLGLTDTSSGHTLLAFADDVTRARMLNHHVKVEGEVDIDPGQLFAVLEDVREKGYATMSSVQIGGVTNIAVPVFGLNGQIHAAINVPYIARIDGMRRPDVDQIIQVLLDISARLSKKMGFFEHS